MGNRSSSLEDTHSTCSSGKHSASSPELIHHSNFAQTRTLTPVGNTIRKENNLDSYDDQQSSWERVKNKNNGKSKNSSLGRTAKNKKRSDHSEKNTNGYAEDVEKERERAALEKEIQREKERQRAEEVEREILRKREDNKANNKQDGS